MDSCTIYNHQLTYSTITKILAGILPHAEKNENSEDGITKIEIIQKGNLFSKKKTTTVSYRERSVPSYNLQEASDPLEQNLIGMIEFVGSIPATNKNIQELFIEKIKTVNSEATITCSSGYSKEFIKVINSLCDEGEPFLFVHPGNFFGKKRGQHFLNHHHDLILDTKGNTEIENLSVKIDADLFDQKDNVSDSSLKRREESEKILKKHQIKINKMLPVISEDVQLRPLSEITDRIYCLLIYAAKGEGIPFEQLSKAIESNDITQFTPNENQILTKENISDQDKANATWRYESLYLLLWAVNKIDALSFPSNICPVEEMVGMLLKESKDSFLNTVKHRSEEEILDILDLTYRMNWACVDARVNGLTVDKVIPGVVFERHYALNWLINYQDQDWDYVRTDT